MSAGNGNGGPGERGERPPHEAPSESGRARRDWPGFDDFDDLIRDPEYDFDEPSGGSSEWEDPSDAYRRFSARAQGAGGFGPAGGGDRGAADAIARIIELLGGLATEALPAETRRQVERMLRDLLVVLRDTIDRLIDRLDEHNLDDDVEIEEIRVD
ncbi:MAG: hypothetical protein HZB14_08095 [Actinobacteria bacterium]|nr:hypothetical protein [Actinomycetota bacterium]